VVHSVKVPLGTFACSGIEANLDADITAGVRAAISDFTQRLESGRAPVELPGGPLEGISAEPTTVVDLTLDERTWQLLWREACRQETTVSQLAAHSVLVYLAELDRLTPPGNTVTA
jgi:hypothetical protein